MQLGSLVGSWGAGHAERTLPPVEGTQSTAINGAINSNQLSAPHYPSKGLGHARGNQWLSVVISAPHHPSKGFGHAYGWSTGVLHKKTTGQLQMIDANYRAAAAAADAAAAATVGLHPLATALKARTLLLCGLLKLLARLGSALSQLRDQEGMPQQPRREHRRERRRLKVGITLPLLPIPLLPYRPGIARTGGHCVARTDG